MSDFICNICGNTVNKRKSLAYKDGRACRHHPEVQLEFRKELKETNQARIEELKELTGRKES